MSPPAQVRARRSLLWLAAAACALRLKVSGPCFAAQAPPRRGSRLGRGSAARRSHAHGRPIADMSTEFFRNAVASIEDVKVLADVSVAPDGKATLGGIPVYARPRTGAALHKGTGPAGEPAALRAHPAQGVLELAALSGNEAALDGVELITHRRALRQLLRWAVRDPEFEGQEWQKQFRAGERKDMDLVAEWVELPGGRGRSLAVTGTYPDKQDDDEDRAQLARKRGLLRTILEAIAFEVAGLRPVRSHRYAEEEDERAPSFEADFERQATGGGGASASGLVVHRRLLSYSLGGVRVLLSAETDAVTKDGRAVRLDSMPADRYRSEFLKQRLVDLYFQMRFGGAELLALGLLDLESNRLSQPLGEGAEDHAAARLEEVREFTLEEMEDLITEPARRTQKARVALSTERLGIIDNVLGRVADILKELTVLCKKSSSSGPFGIVIQDGILEVSHPPPGAEDLTQADEVVDE